MNTFKKFMRTICFLFFNLSLTAKKLHSFRTHLVLLTGKKIPNVCVCVCVCVFTLLKQVTNPVCHQILKTTT